MARHRLVFGLLLACCVATAAWPPRLIGAALGAGGRGMQISESVKTRRVLTSERSSSVGRRLAVGRPGTVAQPETVDLSFASDQAVVVTPVADTWYETDGFEGWLPDPTPHGTENRLSAGWNHLNGERRAVMRFDLPTPPAGQRIAGGELRLAILMAGVNTYSPPYPVSGTMEIAMRLVESDWDEYVLNGAEPPTTSRVLLYADVPWGPCGDSDCGSASIDIAELVEAWYSAPAQPNRGFTLTARGHLDQASFGASYVIASRELDRPPELHLVLARQDETPVSTPSSAPTSSTSPPPTPTPTQSPLGGPKDVYLPDLLRSPSGS